MARTLVRLFALVGAFALALLSIVSTPAFAQGPAPKPAYVDSSVLIGSLAKFTDHQKVGAANISGDCQTTGTLVLTCNLATLTQFGLVKPDGTTLGVTGGVLTVLSAAGIHSSGSSILKGDGAGGLANVTIGAGLSLVGSTLANTSTATVGTSGTPTTQMAKFTDVTHITNAVPGTDFVAPGANTWSGLQTLSLGAVVTPETTPATNEVGYLGAPQNLQNASYTLVMSDAGKFLYHNNATAYTWTIPANASVAFPIGTTIVLVNENASGNITIAITTDTLRWTSSTGSRTLAPNGTVTLFKVDSTTWRLTGDGVS